ncbi:MAG: mechanosensitive ion channel [Methylococcus sp.]|nr:mechanosensitive ion channel [Methylococcus sp.]
MKRLPLLYWLHCGALAFQALYALAAAAEPALSLAAPKTEASPPPASPPSPEALRPDIQRKLEEASALRDKLAADPTGTGTIQGLTAEDLAQAQRQADILVYIYRIELETLSELEDAARNRDEAKAREGSWPGFDKPPPYSILLLDDLHDALDAAQTKIAAFESAQAQTQRDAQRYETDAKQEKATLRLANEATEQAKTVEDGVRARSKQTLAQLRERVMDNRLAWNGLNIDLVKIQLETAKSESALLHKQIAVAARNSTFSTQDLESVQDKLQQNLQSLEREQQRVLADHDRWSRERDAASRALDQAKAATEPPQPAEFDTLKARLKTADAWLQSIRFRTYAINTMITIGRHMADLWNQRYTLASSSDPEARRQALSLIKLSIERLQPILPYIDGDADLVYADERAQAGRLGKLQADTDEVRGYEQSTAEAYRTRKDANQRLRIFVDRTERTLRRWQDEYKVQVAGLGIEDRLSEFFAVAAELGKSLWRFELFAVDDTIDIEGKTVSISRSVTFGKTTGALLLFLLGYWLSGVFTRRVQHAMTARFGIDAPQANLFRRWLRAACILALLLIVLNFMSIPVTAFAFLGGALAIGVGFGTQTLLKNFISGALILFERKIKVGDIVEVDGIVGTVTDVDVRSSTVRGFDGVETMLPNSTFLEHKVTNWTYTTPKLRRSVKIGVAYGSPSHRVSDILLECAGRHGLILDDPAPFVWFEDFGESALIFGVYYWLEMHPTMSAYQIASDLRFMIEKRFAEDGIALAFPQRDIHLDTSRPLQIEIVPNRN